MRYLAIITLLLWNFALATTCSECDSFNSCNTARTLSMNNSLSVAKGRVKYLVSGKNCCRNDYYKIKIPQDGTYRIKLVAHNSKHDKVRLYIKTRCPSSENLFKKVIRGSVEVVESLKKNQTLYIRVEGIAYEGLTDYTLQISPTFCDFFGTPLGSEESISLDGAMNVEVCGSLAIRAKSAAQNGSVLTCSNDCKSKHRCQRIDPARNRWKYRFKHSEHKRKIPSDHYFDKSDYKNLTFTNITEFMNFSPTFTFKATTRYSNSNDQKFMSLGRFDLTGKSDVTFNFYPGDYYFDGINLAGVKTIKFNILGEGPVRIFVDGNFNAMGAGELIVNDQWQTDDLFFVVGGQFNAQVGKQRFYGYLYSKRQINFTTGDTIYTGGVYGQSDIHIVNGTNKFIFKPFAQCPQKRSYCAEMHLSEGFHIVDPNGGDANDSFEIYCDMSSEYAPRDLIALPLKNDFNNFVFDSDHLSSKDYYKEAKTHSHGFDAIHIYARTLEVITDPQQRLPLRSGDYSVMGSSFSNINLIATPFAIDWSNTSISKCNEEKLRKGYYGQAVKINTLDYDNAICHIDKMQLKLLDDYTYLTYNDTEVLEKSCKTLSEAVPEDVLPSEKIRGHFWISPYRTTRDQYNSITSASHRPIVVYCWFQTDLNWAWTFLLALDGKRTITKDDLIYKRDTCSALGLWPFVPLNEESFERVRKFLKNSKKEWSNYTGTIEEKVNALTGHHYYLATERNSLIWPYGSFGVYYDKDDNRRWGGEDVGTNSHTPGPMAGSPMHNIPEITSDYAHTKEPGNRNYYQWTKKNYPRLDDRKLRYSTTDSTAADGKYSYKDTMGAKGWTSILHDLNISDRWFISRTGAGLNFDNDSGSWPYYEPNGNYDAGCWLNYLYDENGYVRHNDDWNCNYPYYDYMCMAEDNYFEVVRYRLLKGPYDLIDRSVPNGEEMEKLFITTKVVNKPIQLDLVLLNDDRTRLLKEDELKNLKLSTGIFLAETYFEGENEKVREIKFLGELNDFEPKAARIPLDALIGKDFSLDSAKRRVFVKFKFCNRNGTRWSECWNTSLNGGCKSGKESLCASADSNDFAVRPEKFTFTISPLQKIIAGEETRALFGAVDVGGNYARGYNEGEGNSFDINVSLADPSKNCQNDRLQIKDILFEDGKADTTITFDDVGEFNLTIAEINGSEFAKVDANDTDPSQRFITPFTTTISIIPDHFDIVANVVPHNPKGFTYLSNDLAMSTIVELNITAKNAKNEVTRNYTKSCYAKDHELNLTYVLSRYDTALDTLIELESTSGLYQEHPINGSIETNLSHTAFGQEINGSATTKIYTNFKRYVDRPVAPFTFTLHEVNTTDSDKATGSTTPSSASVVYYYARIHSADESVNTIDGNEGNVSIYYEIYDPSATTTSGTTSTTLSAGGLFNSLLSSPTTSLPQSVDTVDWYINTDHTPTDGRIYQILFEGVDLLTSAHAPLAKATLAPLSGGKHLLHLKYTGSTAPYTAQLDINASSWLIYDKYDPSASTSSFKVKFTMPGVWMGVGENFSNQDESNLSRHNKYRIEW